MTPPLGATVLAVGVGFVIWIVLSILLLGNPIELFKQDPDAGGDA